MELFALERGFQYDAVILARPDTWFHVDTDLPRQEAGWLAGWLAGLLAVSLCGRFGVFLRAAEEAFG